MTKATEKTGGCEIAPAMALWESVCKTPPEYVKSITGKSYSAINPMYVVQTLTRVLEGPNGEKWVVIIDEDKLVEGHWLSNGKDRYILHVIKGHLRYYRNGQWYETNQQYGQTPFVYETRSGDIKSDEDAFKKSATDLMTKCASLLGVAADVFLGQYDGNKYIDKDFTGRAEDLFDGKAEPEGGAKKRKTKAEKEAEQWADEALKPKPKSDKVRAEILQNALQFIRENLKPENLNDIIERIQFHKEQQNLNEDELKVCREALSKRMDELGIQPQQSAETNQ